MEKLLPKLGCIPILNTPICWTITIGSLIVAPLAFCLSTKNGGECLHAAGLSFILGIPVVGNMIGIVMVMASGNLFPA